MVVAPPSHSEMPIGSSCGRCAGRKATRGVATLDEPTFSGTRLAPQKLAYSVPPADMHAYHLHLTGDLANSGHPSIF